MAPRILAVGTAVPAARIGQAATRDFFLAQPGIDATAARLITTVFDHSEIEWRHSVLGNITEGAGHFTDAKGALLRHSTRKRNDVYRHEAPKLLAAAAQQALDESGIDPSGITHVVTASCTGSFAPGPDFRLMQDLGLPRTVERFHLGFMGCAAGLPALRLAKHICAGDPSATVLVACVELCSIHIRSSRDPEQIVASAIFRDGAGAAIVSSSPRIDERPTLALGNFGTEITRDGEADMDWTIGDEGFEMRLTSEVPRIIGREIAGVVDRMLGAADPGAAHPDPTIAAWAVHRGGKSILDRVATGLRLGTEALSKSRAVLREFGNMSSATILFILQRILADDTIPDGGRVAALAFGPGLTVETGLFIRRAGRLRET